MVFSSLYFLFLFFPVVMVLHWVLPKPLKNPVLFLASIFFYAWGEPVYVVLMLFSTVFNYVMGLDLARLDGTYRKKQSLIFAVTVNLLMLGFFKYFGFLIGIINAVTPLNLAVRTLPLPIGISFYTFQALSYVIDIYRGQVKAQRSFLLFGVYLTMFPQLVAGPIVKYSDVEERLTNRRVSLNDMGVGMERLVYGLAKKVLLANNLGALYTAIQTAPERSALTVWIGLIAYGLQVYFDFSGYSDMAIGMGRMLGFRFPENFNYPFMANSITDFWRRWHMTLYACFRDYVYIPLGGNRRGTVIQIRNMIIVWALTGLWHGANWNFVLWGLYYGILLIVEKFFFGAVLERMHAWSQHLITMLLVTLGWVLFSNTDMSQAASFCKGMIGLGGGGLVDAASLYYLTNNFILLTIGGLCCVPLMKKWMDRRVRSNPIPAAVLTVGLFLLCTAYLVSGTYNPFLYFRF